MKPCLEYLELMNAVLDGEATPVQHEALSAHLAQCPACAALYEDLKALREGSDALVTKAPENLKANVMSCITAETSNVISFPAKNKKKTASRWRSLAAMAAVFALVIGVGTTQDLFGGSSSAPMPSPSAAPAAAEPAEAAEQINDLSRITDSKSAADTDILADIHQYTSSSDTYGKLEAQMNEPNASNSSHAPAGSAPAADPAEAAVSYAPAAPSATPENAPVSVALDMVVYRIYGESGYTWEPTYSEDGSICHIRLHDGETVVDEGIITYTGLSENGKFYCFAWTWADQTEEDALLYRYAVPLDLSYVMWAGDTPDMENYDLTLEN